MRLLWLAFVVLASLAPGGLTMAGTLKGQVLEDHTGTPLPGVLLRISPAAASRALAELETDGSGGFELKDLPAGRYRIEASKAIYLPADLQVEVEPAAEPATMIRLIRLGVVSGQILDTNNNPVRDAYVYALTLATQDGGLQRFWAFSSSGVVRTNSEGRYRHFRLPPGRYMIAAAYGASAMGVGSSGMNTVSPTTGSGYEIYPAGGQARIFEISGGERYEDIDFRIMPRRLYRVSGKVEGAAAPSRYWVTLVDPKQPVLAVAATDTAQDGSFAFEHIAEGAYDLFASGPIGGRSGRGALLEQKPRFGRSSVQVAGRDAADVVIPVAEGRSVRLQLQPSAGACPTSATVKLFSREEVGADLERIVPLEAGQATLVEGLAPVVYEAEVTGAGTSCYGPSGLKFDAAASDPDAVILIPLNAAASIEGEVTGAEPGQRLAVILLPCETGGSVEQSRVAYADGKGRFEFTPSRPGCYRIAVRDVSDGRTAWFSDLGNLFTIELEGGAPTHVKLPVVRRVE